MTIMRWDPFRELEQMEREMDRIWGSGGQRRMPSQRRRAELAEMAAPAVDIWETSDAVMAQIAMPGVRPEDLQVSVTDNTLTIRGEMKPREAKEGERWHRQEIQYGMYDSTITLPPYANAEQVEANYENGVLTLRLPKREQSRARQIPVRASGNNSQQQGQQRTIEGQRGDQQQQR
jgi:HSP20 family protein